MEAPLLTTKLGLPLLNPNRVPRRRLLDLLNGGLLQPHGFTRRLTLVSAPAGYGKTTLIADWLGKTGNPVAWLSLDEGENDPVRFQDYLIAALAAADGDIQSALRSLEEAPRHPPEPTLAALINALAATPVPFFLVLDDYHVIRAGPVHQQLTFLLNHMPPGMHLVLATREDPPFPLSRLRASGEIGEVRQAALRFTQDEVIDFLRRVMGLNLSSQDIAALERRTEGWIAGLQLVALSMQGEPDVQRFVRSFTGSSRYILDYLIEEVLERQPASIQAFLLQTSILERMTASLCDAVAGRSGSQRVLEFLEQANLFIVPLDHQREWYRYHRLFVELLRHRLRDSGAYNIDELHARACRWFQAHNHVFEAVGHALMCQDWDQAGALIEATGETMLRRGEVQTLLGWFASLPEESLCDRPKLCLSYGWALILTSQYDPAEAILARAELGAQDDTAFLGSVRAGQAYLARARGDHLGARELSRQALGLLPEEDPLNRSLVALTLGLTEWSYGTLEDARQALLTATREARRARNHYAEISAMSFLAAIQIVQGHLHHAAQLSRQVLGAGLPTPAKGFAEILLGVLAYQWNRLDEAADHVERGIELSRRIGNVEYQREGYRHLALARQAQGRPEAAQAALTALLELDRDHEITPLSRARNAACEAEVALAQGEIEVAEQWAEAINQDAGASLFAPRLGLVPARLLLARGETWAARASLEGLHELARQAGWKGGLIAVRTLQALAARDPVEARAFLLEALEEAEPEDYLRVFLDHGQPVRSLIASCRPLMKTPALRAYADHILGAAQEIPEWPGRSEPWTAALVEDLSKREIEVLQLVAAGRSNREIAGLLVVSVGTVKSHVHHILGKLGARNRTQAVSRARDLRIL